ncbi:MAG: Gfo/Idh/MocA family oxidoreductase, partial [Phycisphaerae bacterium]|nr:Gfo/Idh/MocA family oxidoreductase [Phycisphaerae bacterium]
MALTAGVIGCGNIVRFHFSGLEKAGARVKWVCDISEDAARPWVEKTGAQYTTDYKQILADPEVDVVHVTLISTLHKQMCIDAINAGKAVVCEKTLATSADDALEIVSLAEKKQTLFYTSYMKRFIPAV